jgi:hypothetical protein
MGGAAFASGLVDEKIANQPTAPAAARRRRVACPHLIAVFATSLKALLSTAPKATKLSSCDVNAICDQRPAIV